MKRSILFIHHVAAIGGGSYCLLNLIRSLDRDLYDPSVLLGEDGPLAVELRKEDIPLDILPEMMPLPYNKSLWRRSCIQRYLGQNRSLKAFERYLAAHPEFDIVYLNNMLLCPYLRIAKDNGRKTVIHIREHWSKGEHPLQFLYVHSMIEKWADRIIAINRYAASRFDAVRTKTEVVYDWIDMNDRYEFMPYSSIFGYDTSGLKVFLYVGGLNPIKGIHEIVEVFHRSAGNDCRLLIVGNNPVNSPARPMRKTCETINADSRIRCIPSTYKIRHLIEQAYCTVSFFTVPHANLFLAESLICKIPAIAAMTEEAYEYSESGTLAALFPFKSKRAFARAMQMSDAEYDALKARVVASSDKVAGLFDRQRNLSCWHEAIKDI